MEVVQFINVLYIVGPTVDKPSVRLLMTICYNKSKQYNY